jgi:hypothetical protein
MLLDHGDGHVIITLRTIVESSSNERALTAADNYDSLRL